MLVKRQRGLTLLELMIGLVIIALLLMMGIPAFGLWIQNTQNRGAAESLLNGLQQTRMESVRRNKQVRFEITDTTGKVAWKFGCVTVTTDCPAIIQEYAANEGNGRSRIGVSRTAIPLPTPATQFDTIIAPGTNIQAGVGVTFDGIGRVPGANAGLDITRIDVTTESNGRGKRYVVMIAPGGQIRMCDPSLAFSANPQGCS